MERKPELKETQSIYLAFQEFKQKRSAEPIDHVSSFDDVGNLDGYSVTMRAPTVELPDTEPYKAYKAFLTIDFNKVHEVISFLNTYGPPTRKTETAKGEIIINVGDLKKLQKACNNFIKYMKPNSKGVSPPAKYSDDIETVLNPNLKSKLGAEPVCYPAELIDYFKCIVYFQTFKAREGSPDIFCQFEFKNGSRSCNELIGPIVGGPAHQVVCSTHQKSKNARRRLENRRLQTEWESLKTKMEKTYYDFVESRGEDVEKHIDVL